MSGVRSILNLPPYQKTKYGRAPSAKAPCAAALNAAYMTYFPSTKSGSRYAPFAHKKCKIIVECHASIYKNKCYLCDKNGGSLMKEHNVFCSKYAAGKDVKAHRCLECSFETAAIEQMKIHISTKHRKKR